MAVTFDSIGNGELAGMFKTALAQIGRNILDPNMDPEAARGMTINIKFKPNTSGTILTSYDVKTKLAGQKKAETTLLIGRMPGRDGWRSQSITITGRRYRDMMLCRRNPSIRKPGKFTMTVQGVP